MAVQVDATFEGEIFLSKKIKQQEEKKYKYSSIYLQHWKLVSGHHLYLNNLMVFHCLTCIQELSKVNENLQKALERNPREGELAEVTNMSVAQVRRHLEVGRAARSKLIKVSKTLFSTPSIISMSNLCSMDFTILSAR